MARPNSKKTPGWLVPGVHGRRVCTMRRPHGWALGRAGDVTRAGPTACKKMRRAELGMFNKAVELRPLTLDGDGAAYASVTVRRKNWCLPHRTVTPPHRNWKRRPRSLKSIVFLRVPFTEAAYLQQLNALESCLLQMYRYLQQECRFFYMHFCDSLVTYIYCRKYWGSMRIWVKIMTKYA